MHAEGFAAAILERDGLLGLSRERVRAELLKGLVAPRAGEVIGQVCDAGLLGGLLAGACYPSRLRGLIEIEAARGEAPDPLLRTAAMTVLIEEDAERLRDRLRLSNGETDRLTTLARAAVALHGIAAPPSLGALRILLFERGRQGARDAANQRFDIGVFGLAELRVRPADDAGFGHVKVSLSADRISLTDFGGVGDRQHGASLTQQTLPHIAPGCHGVGGGVRRWGRVVEQAAYGFHQPIGRRVAQDAAIRSRKLLAQAADAGGDDDAAGRQRRRGDAALAGFAVGEDQRIGPGQQVADLAADAGVEGAGSAPDFNSLARTSASARVRASVVRA